MADFTFVDDDARLRGLVESWRKVPELAIDLEMEAHLHHFGLHLSLAQVSDGRDVWLIDMLAIKDPSAFVGLMQDARVLKVFHDVSFDFRVLEELYGCHPHNVQDTKLAAMLLGKPSISLSGLLQEYFGVEKKTKYQRVDWMRRPLDAGMLSYAAGDVKLLLQLKDKLVGELREKGRYPWFEEECAAIEHQSFATEPRTFQDVKGARSMTDQERGVLKEFYAERDAIAERLDKPIFFIIPDKLLVALAKQPPRDEESWQRVKGVHPMVKRRAFRFVKAAQRARPVAKVSRHRRRLSFHQQEEVDALLARRDKVLPRLGVEPHVLMTRDQAERWVLGERDVFHGWQRSLLEESKVI